MAIQLLNIVAPYQLAQNLEDFILSNQHLVSGFTSSSANGHGSAVTLVQPSELVSGHSPRIVFQLVADEKNISEILQLAKIQFDKTNVYYWIETVLQAGQL